MNRLCERPGCSAPAEVAYGFDADHLIVWLDTLVTVQSMRHGVLCRRHADAMIVPLGWMLDDRREPTPRLFKTAGTVPSEPAPQPRRERRQRDSTGEQLRLEAEVVAALDETGDEAAVPVEAPIELPAAAPSPVPAAGDERAQPAADDPDDAADATVVPAAEPGWVPVFDPDDDLHGLLNARGRLLSRAFNGAPLHRD